MKKGRGGGGQAIQFVLGCAIALMMMCPAFIYRSLKASTGQPPDPIGDGCQMVPCGLEHGTGIQLRCPRSESFPCSMLSCKPQFSLINGQCERNFTGGCQPDTHQLCSQGGIQKCELNGLWSACTASAFDQPEWRPPPQLRVPSPRHPFIFAHLRKCGGTSLRWMLHQSAIHHKLGYFIPGLGPDADHYSVDIIPEHRSKVAVIAAHVNWGHEEHLLGGNGEHAQLDPGQNRFHYFTVLREPFHRVVSCYYFRYHPYMRPKLDTKTIPNQPLPQLRKIMGTWVDKYGNSCNNEAVRILSGVTDEYLLARLSEKTPEGRMVLSWAKTNLAKSVVGILEDYNTSIAMLKFWNPWFSTASIHRFLNKGRKSGHETYSGEVRELIRELNSLDYQLYDYGMELFKKQAEFMKYRLQITDNNNNNNNNGDIFSIFKNSNSNSNLNIQNVNPSWRTWQIDNNEASDLSFNSDPAREVGDPRRPTTHKRPPHWLHWENRKQCVGLATATQQTALPFRERMLDLMRKHRGEIRIENNPRDKAPYARREGRNYPLSGADDHNDNNNHRQEREYPLSGADNNNYNRPEEKKEEMMGKVEEKMEEQPLIDSSKFMTLGELLQQRRTSKDNVQNGVSPGDVKNTKDNNKAGYPPLSDVLSRQLQR